MRRVAIALLAALAAACAPSRPRAVSSAAPAAPAREPADDDWDHLVAAFRNERWEDAYRDASDLESRYANDPDGRQAEIRWIELVALAGRVSIGLARREDVNVEAQRMIGQRLRTLPRPLLPRAGRTGLGPTHAGDPASARHALDQVATRAGTYVLLVNSIALRAPFDFPRHAGERAVASGVLRTVQVHPRISRGVIGALALDDGTIEPVR